MKEFEAVYIQVWRICGMCNGIGFTSSSDILDLETLKCMECMGKGMIPIYMPMNEVRDYFTGRDK